MPFKVMCVNLFIETQGNNPVIIFKETNSQSLLYLAANPCGIMTRPKAAAVITVPIIISIEENIALKILFM